MSDKVKPVPQTRVPAPASSVNETSNESRNVSGLSRKSITLGERPIIDSLIILEQIERFHVIVNRDLVSKVSHLDQLIRDEFHDLEKMKERCLTKEQTLDSHFPKLSGRKDIDQYQRMCRLSGNPDTVLFAKGLYPVNRELDRLAQLLMDELEGLYEQMYECSLTIELVKDSYEERNISENSFVEEILSQFDSFRSWSFSQCFTLTSFQADFQIEKILQIHYFPQYEDRRRAFYRGEMHQVKSLIEIVHNLLFTYINLVDLMRKNQNRLAIQLSKVQQVHRERVAQFREKQHKNRNKNNKKNNQNNNQDKKETNK